MPISTAHRGMARRPSATASSAPASTARLQRSVKDLHHAPSANPPLAYTMTYPPPGPSGAPQDKMVLALIKRLIANLPWYSGHSLPEVESDDSVILIIQSLAELSCHSIDVIVWKLTEELEKLPRVDGPHALDVLQSQLLLLKVMAVTMGVRWQQQAASTSNAEAKLFSSGFGTANASFISSSRTAQSKPQSSTPYFKQSNRPGTAESIPGATSSASLQFSLEAPPLDENCALWLLSVLVLLLRQTAPVPPRSEDPILRGRWPTSSLAGLYSSLIAKNFVSDFDASLYGFESADFDGGLSAFIPDKVMLDKQQLNSSSSSPTISVQRPLESPRSPPAIMSSATSFSPTPRALAGSPLSLHNLIGHWAGTVVYLVSAGNWNVVFQRIRSKIHALATDLSESSESLSAANSHEDNGGLDVGDLGLIQHCAMDRARLIQILQELSSLLVNMKREGQATVAVALRKAIWNWIEIFPDEYNDVVSGKRRLDGAPERVFDLLCQKDDFVIGSSTSGAQKAAMAALILPTLNMLILISHDRMKSLTLQGQPGVPRVIKELQVIETIRKNTTWTAKFSDIAFMAAVESCKAASRIYPENDVPLRSVASEICDDIKARLFKSMDDRPFYDAPKHIDVALFADALVAIYHFLPEDEVATIFTTCLEPERSAAVKMTVVKACITLVIESQRTQSSHPIKQLRNWTASRIVAILKSSINRCSEVDRHGSVKHPASRPACKRFTSETISDGDLLMLSIMALYRIEFRFFLEGSEKEDANNGVVNVMQILSRPGDPSVSFAFIRTFMHNINRLATRRAEETFEDLGGEWLSATIPTVLFASANGLLDARENFSEQRLCIDIAYATLNLFKGPVDEALMTYWRESKLREPAMITAEIAFLVAVTSADNVVSTTACRALRALARLEQLTPPPKRIPAEQITRRYPIYEQLGNVKIMAVGRLNHQKRVRKCMRALAMPSTIHAAVWEECYWRWAGLESSAVFRSVDDSQANGSLTKKPVGDKSMSPEERFHQWQNLTLFLAAFGAACSSSTVESDALTSMIPAKYLADRFRVLQDTEDVLSTYIMETIDLLIAENIHGRECAKDALGNELNPRLYGRLFRRLNDEIDDIIRGLEDPVKADGLREGDGTVLAFFDQFMTVLKLLVEREDTRMEDVSENVDLSSTLLAIAEYINQSHSVVASRIKHKLCSFCYDALGRTDALGLRKDDKVRNHLVGLISGWLQQSDTTMPGGHDENHNLSLYDWNMVILRAIVKLLEHLRLQPSEGFPGDDIPHAVSRRFLHFQKTLLDALSFERELLEEDAVSRSSRTLSIHKSSEREIQLRECIMTGLAHLLSANKDIGLSHFLPLGYNEDPKLRVIFCHAMARTLGLGTQFDISPTADMTVQGKNSLCELVKRPDLTLVFVMCDACPPNDEVETLTSVLFHIFDSRASLMPLLKEMVEREVKSTSSITELFRGNNMRIRFLSHFAREHGYDYLRSILQPLVHQMCNIPEDHSWELDPNKAPDQDVRKNEDAIAVAAKAFVDMICASERKLPPMIKELCIHIRRSVVDHDWKEHGLMGVGSFLFLRFISPALVDPTLVDIELPQKSSDIRRGLLFIGKILQNLLTGALFSKEQHMIAFNTFIELNHPYIVNFLAKIDECASVDSEPDDWVPEPFDETDPIIIRRFVERHAEKIGKELLSLSQQAEEGETSNAGGKKVWDVLCDQLVTSGITVEIPRLSQERSSYSQSFKKFMTRNAERSVGSLESFFHEATAPQHDQHVFVFSLYKIETDLLDVELALFQVFKVLLTDDREFRVILDCTGFSSASEVTLPCFRFCLEMIPSDIRARCTGIHVLHPNLAMLRFLRKLYNVCTGWQLAMEAHISLSTLVESLSRQGQRHLVNLQGALGRTAGLEKEAHRVIYNVSQRQGDVRSHVDLVVAETHIRVTSVKVHKIVPKLPSKSVDIHYYEDIADIYNVSLGNANEFVIRLNRSGQTLYLTSPDREYIVKSIRSAKNSAGKSHSRGRELFQSLSNIFASLLNIGFLNMTDDSHSVQTAALQLLSATCSYLDFEDTPLLPSSKAGLLPTYPNSFVMLLSERLAAFAPQLSLDFIIGASKNIGTPKRMTMTQKLSCLQYIAPWIKNLSKFSNPANDLYDPTTKLRDCFMSLVNLTLQETEVFRMVQQYMWVEIGKLDSITVDIVLDEIIRAASDGGIASSRCEAMADTITSISSTNVRGRLLSRIRKMLNKSASKTGSSVYWAEIATLAYLAEASGRYTQPTNHHQLFIPETMHIVSLLAATSDTPVRIAIFGIVANIVQSLYFSQSDEPSLSQTGALLDLMTSPNALQSFGLARHSLTTEYISYEPSNDDEAIDSLEKLSDLLQNILAACAGDTGQANIWRARWMSLSTSAAFQLSASIQYRAFVMMGTLATTDVDDDLLYQMLAALRATMKTSDESDTLRIISMLRCICNVVPGLPKNSRYLPQVFWLAVALLESAKLAFFKEASTLLCTTLQTLEKQAAFRELGLAATLLNARRSIDDTLEQLDAVLNISFDANLSFSLAAVIFKGVRRPQLQDAALTALRTLLSTSVRVSSSQDRSNSHLQPESLGYFLASLSASISSAAFRRLLQDACLDPRELMLHGTHEVDDTPSIAFECLNCPDSSTALLIASFISMMLSSAQGDDIESQLLYGLLAGMTNSFPDTVSIVYESLQDKIHDAFSNSSNPAIIASVSKIFLAIMDDPSRTLGTRGSSSTLSTLDEAPANGPALRHIQALDDMKLRGIASSFQFVDLEGTKVLVNEWFPELITKIID